MFRSRTLSRFTERLQTQYDVWLDQQRQIEEAKAAEFALTLGFEDNPNTGKVKALVDEFKAFLEETDLAELAKLVKAQFSYETDLPDEEFQQKVRTAVDEILAAKKDDPAETKKSFMRFVVN